MPDYETFAQFLREYTNVNTGDNSNTYFYKYLLARYANSNVNYDTIDAFKRNFGITYEDNFDQYAFRRKVLQEQYNLTVDELTVINVAITNTALNNNEETTNPLDKVIDYISNQQSGKTNENKLIGYVRALEEVTNKYLRDFLDQFRPHFMQILTTQNDYFEEV